MDVQDLPASYGISLEDFVFEDGHYLCSALDTQSHIDWGFNDQPLLPLDISADCSDGYVADEPSEGDLLSGWDVPSASTFDFSAQSTQDQNDDEWLSLLEQPWIINENEHADHVSNWEQNIDQLDLSLNDNTDNLRSPQHAAAYEAESTEHGNFEAAQNHTADPGPWPSPSEWEHQRDTITNLYVSDGKSLKDVMWIMELCHGHKGT